MNRIASRKYIDGSRGQPCTMRIVGVCTGGGEDTVFAHIRDRHTGRSIKASDISGCDACFACHEVFDRRAKVPYGDLVDETTWLFIALQGLQETLENRIARGLLFVTHDVHRERVTKPRKPKADRAKVPGGRPIQSNPHITNNRKLGSRPMRAYP